MSSPYSNLPASSFWKTSISETPLDQINIFDQRSFTIDRSDRIVACGSCFAQHISKFLSSIQFNSLITETPHPVLPRNAWKDFGYGIYSARTGNVYTARQLLQLFLRAYGLFKPTDVVWPHEDHLVDPFRPRIQPGGFINKMELLSDRQFHFNAVRRMFEDCDVFIFTLGLTETWMHREDGSVYPLCPGVSGGTFDKNVYGFHNFSVSEVADDLSAFIEALRKVNPKVRILLTVSPVPLVATMEPKSVLTSTVLSKSTLRVAVEETLRRHQQVDYFPSYEIITGPIGQGRFFDDNLRTVNQIGVNYVMRTFARQYMGLEPATSVPSHAHDHSTVGSRLSDLTGDKHQKMMEDVIEVLCDEEALEG